MLLIDVALMSSEPRNSKRWNNKMANIFVDETTEDVVDTIKQTMSVAADEDGDISVSFATNADYAVVAGLATVATTATSAYTTTH